MLKLTARQEEILEFIKDYLQETGFPPTRSEIAAKMGFKSPNAAEEHLRALARKGAIEMLPGTSRGLRIPINEQLGLPIIGQVAAGSPILAEESISDYCEIPPDMFSPAADYLLTVKGTSMIDVGIYEDDLLVVHKTDKARNGDIVVARIDDEVTVKRLEMGRSKYKLNLLPENPDYEPIEVDTRTEDFAIEGISVGVIRRSV
ncbi:MAG: transcriptional repressor LexA [Gammaproteobacteria bacterium]|jgi:repressor LexA|nr:transcriptional repressor LexA [Gammaproteobacteria bacterium]MBT3858761.1 transcriptional repressor LexA [Gammaproteobacteria bacterium]MBT3986113.1 transcriptional repressor LexA [Gammaproteobacteria bacterium]MBT4256352.1 transcriptional repressor LexA [Gammaproteobacteria bacterium]MBT4581026.1 transcriptional repressor LexA [Gammaproteobacteria bacterium]